MRFRATILVKLLVALVLPTVALFSVFAYVAYDVSRRDLDDELGRRLEAISASAATQIRGKYLVEGEDETEQTFQNQVHRLKQIAQATGADMTVFDRNYTTRADTTDETAVGTKNFRAQLDREELASVFESGKTVSSVTFTGRSGRIYKAGYAAVRASESEPEIVLAVRAQAPASYFARLAELKGRLFVWGAGLVLVSILAALITTLVITRNIRRLASAAERIGAGDLREPVRIRTRDEIGVLGQAMDRMREQLAERDARTQQMLAGIAHEVRNPLAGMTLFAGILRDEIPADDERRGHVDKIQRELGYLERVVNDFLEYARRPKPELGNVEVAELLAEVAQLASNDDMPITIEAQDEMLRADRGQLRRALLNLAKNAVQAAKAAGHTGKDAVKLSVARDGGETKLVVWNRGKEIPPETSGRLFEPFFTTREKGTGLGLAFVREIVVDHGGRIEVASAGGETTFTIVLPA
ncbi:MAG: HAMP domain-containing histidine kinase [Myxococcota bacterium]|nr:HAMP domain-containing histidine kinase [Myxococcota bacterium]